MVKRFLANILWGAGGGAGAGKRRRRRRHPTKCSLGLWWYNQTVVRYLLTLSYCPNSLIWFSLYMHSKAVLTDYSEYIKLAKVMAHLVQQKLYLPLSLSQRYSLGRDKPITSMINSNILVISYELVCSVCSTFSGNHIFTICQILLSTALLLIIE